MKSRDKIDYFNFYKSKGLKITPQRKLILDEFLKLKGHVNTDEFYRLIKKKMPSIGYATVYRTLKLFKESGTALEIDVGDGAKRYESRTDIKSHHDHIYCLSCGKIEEFRDEQIEILQDKIANKLGYQIVNHILQLSGYCEKCAKKVKKNA